MSDALQGLCPLHYLDLFTDRKCTFLKEKKRTAIQINETKRNRNHCNAYGDGCGVTNEASLELELILMDENGCTDALFLA